MKPLRLLLLTAVGAILAGCATVLPPPDAIARVPVNPGKAGGVEVIAATVRLVDGRLCVTGVARIAQSTALANGLHIDVRFLDSGGKVLALKTASIWLTRPRRGVGAPARFTVAIGDWPGNTATVLVLPHHGTHSEHL